MLSYYFLGVDSKLTNALVPKHEILNEKEADKLLEKYKTTREGLPRIKQSDPAIKDLNPKLEDIIRITRNSPTAGTAFYYRVVIEG